MSDEVYDYEADCADDTMTRITEYDEPTDRKHSQRACRPGYA